MKSKLVIAIDPFSDLDLSLKPALMSVFSFADRLKAEVVVAVVVSPDRLKWPGEFDEDWKADFQRLGEAALRSALKKTGMARLGRKIRTVVLEQPKYSPKESAQLLADLAEREEAKALVVFTHGRKRAFALGGAFSSRLVEQCSRPILVLDARGKTQKSWKKFLFATDLSPQGLKTLGESIIWARLFGAELYILNVVMAVPPDFTGGMAMAGGYQFVEGFFEQQEKEARAVGEKWLKVASDSKVKAHLIIASTATGVSDRIIKEVARAKADMLIMNSTSSAVEAAIFGSATRDVLGSIKKPVLLYGRS